MNDDDVAVVVTAKTEFEAETKAQVLRAEGLEAAVVRDAPSWTGHVSINPSAPGASVLVARADLERARTVLEQTVSDSVDIDWEEVDVGERADDLPLHEVNRMPMLAKISFAVALAIVAVTVLWILLAILANLL